MALTSRATLAAVGVAAVVNGCTPPPLPPPPTTAPRIAPSAPMSSGTELERFLPLVGGHVYQYTLQSDGGGKGLLPLRIERVDPQHGAWVLPGGGNAFEYRDDGVLTEGEQGASYVLKLPLEVGRRWPGSHQSQVELRRVGVRSRGPAGEFEGCVETEETRGGDVPLRITTLFCPEVGMVERHVTSGPHEERLTLQSFGPPVDLGPDGLKVLREE